MRTARSAKWALSKMETSPEAPKILKPIPVFLCFWCGIKLFAENKTRDHLISRPLKRLLKCGKNQVVISCLECNLKRSYISQLLGMIKNLQNKKISAHNENQFYCFYRNRNKHEHIVQEFSLLIDSKVSNEFKEPLKLELKTVMDFSNFYCVYKEKIYREGKS